MHNIIGIALYYSNKVISYRNLVLVFLLISPFFELSKGSTENIIKLSIELFFSASIITIWGIQKIYYLDFSFRYNKVFIILFILFSYNCIYSIINLYTENQIFTNYEPLHYAFACLRKLLIFLICYQLFNASNTYRAISLFYYSFFISLIGVILQITGFLGDSWRLASFLYDPNYYGHYLIIIIMMSFIFWRFHNKKRYITIGCLASIILIFTLSRSSYLLLFILLVCSLWFTRDRINFKKKTTQLIILLCTLGFVSIFLALFTFRLSESVLNTSDFGRLSLNFSGINIIQEYPFFGVGIKHSQEIIQNFQDKQFPIITTALVIHNVYIAIAAEMGIPALLLFLYLLYTLITISHKKNNPFSLLAFIIILSYILHGMLYHIYFISNLFWVLLILTLAIHNHLQELEKIFNKKPI